MRRKNVQPLLPFDEAEPRPVTARLIASLASVCAEEPLAEKVFVAPSLLEGHTIVERLAREGHAWTHLRVETIRTLAAAAAGPGLVRDGLRLLSRAQALALVEQACTQALGEGSYFGALRDRTGLHRAMQRTLDELRAAGIAPARLPAAAFADGRKAAELRQVLAGYAEALTAARFIDPLGVLARAAAAEPPADAATLYLLPADAELSELERIFLERLAGNRLRRLPVDDPATWTATAAGVELVRSIGEENEVREVFRRCLAAGLRFDEIEILHTDERVYPALVWELSREHGIPCTFAGGVPVTYSRPGQAALAFLAWVAEGFAADRLRAAIASGAASLRRLATAADAPPGGMVAREIRRARIGWGRRRHLPAIDRLIRELGGPERPSRRDEPDDASPEERSAIRVRRLEAARLARAFVARTLELAPPGPGGRPPTGPPAGARGRGPSRLARAFVARTLELAPPDGAEDPLRGLARGAGAFVTEFARVTDDLDAAARTALETLFAEIAELPAAAIRLEDALERLRDAVGGLAVLADRPRPGRLHVAGFAGGGHSGRRHTFLLGLDETRHPGLDLEDPVLLDDERRRINEALERPLLAIERERPREKARALQACVARLRGRLTASYSKFDIRNLSQAGEPSPSPFFLELHRAKTGTNADYGDLLEALPAPAGFVPAGETALDEGEWWLARLAAGIEPGSGAPLVRGRFPWLEDGRAALAARASDDFTAWDGRLSAAAPELDPRKNGRPTSASLVQALAGCPFAYFVRNVLGVRPPDDLERDATRWLEPRDEGSLLHEVFRSFLEDLTRRGERPDAARHADALFALADERIEAWRERVPPSSEVAFQAQRETIRHACRTFLAAEAEHCRDVTPRWFEVGFGMREAAGDGIASPDPVEIALGRGEKVLLRGSIDRVDEGKDGTFHVWDYKTGSAAGVQEGRGLHGGRQAQPALYALAFEQLLKRSGRDGRVSQSGYFFPGRKGEGQRLTIPVDADETGRALSSLFDLAGAGLFPHAASKLGCRFCDFESVCGGPETSSEASQRKLAAATDTILTAFRQLHGHEDD